MHNAGADKETIPDAMASGISCSGNAVHLARVEPTTRFSTDGDSIQQLIQPGPLNHRQVSPENHGSLQSVRSCFVVDQASDCRTSADPPRDARSPEEPGRASSRMPTAPFAGTGAGVERRRRPSPSLVLGRSKAESSGLVFTTERGTAVDPDR